MAVSQRIFANFSTPLVGTHLNLTQHSVELLCPACGVKQFTRVDRELTCCAAEMQRFVGCLLIALCRLNRAKACRRTNWLHYCANCGCFMGRARRHAPLPPKYRKRIFTVR